MDKSFAMFTTNELLLPNAMYEYDLSPLGFAKTKEFMLIVDSSVARVQ